MNLEATKSVLFYIIYLYSNGFEVGYPPNSFMTKLTGQGRCFSQIFGQCLYQFMYEGPDRGF